MLGISIPSSSRTPYNASHEGWDLKYEHKTSDAQPFRDAQKAVCQKYGVKYIDLFNLMNAGIDTDYYDDVTYENVRHYLNIDGIHYNTVAGSDEITRVIVSELGSH